jgi:excinuclease ABC subunit C
MELVALKNKALPDTPGIYFFMGADKEILYIGRATSLKDRVRSYFAADVIKTRGPRIVDMVFKAADVEFVKADSVLEAVILEANFIKKHQPHYNTKEKDDKSFNSVVITDEAYPAVTVVRSKELEAGKGPKAKYVFGPYPQGMVLREGLKIVRRIFPYRDLKCVPLSGKPCFNYQIGLCPGPCVGAVTKTEYSRNVTAIRLFFEGKKHVLLKKLEREMKAHAKGQEFEAAGEAKRRLFALTHIQDVTLIKEREDEGADLRIPETDPKNFKMPVRIEAYDIAHLGGTNIVGVMTVCEDRHAKKADYRLFKIKGQKGADDTLALREVLGRRLNHPEWQFPTLIAVDGGIAQKNAAEALLKERGFDIAVVAVTKDDKHKPERIQGDLDLAKKYEREILLANSEAHRFAIKYHRKKRSDTWLKR